jgi:hypothetical protein
VLAIDVLGTGVCKCQQLCGMVAGLAALIHFQLHTQIAGSSAVENGDGLIAVGVDRCFAVLSIVNTMGAIGKIIVFIGVVGIAVVDDLSAVMAARVVPVVAAETERCVFVGFGILCPNPFAAVVAGGGFCFITGFA